VRERVCVCDPATLRCTAPGTIIITAAVSAWPGLLLAWQVATFLHHELPIRLAHRARELDNMPDGLYQMPSIQMVKQWYMDSFVAMVSHPKPMSIADEASFLDLMNGYREPIHASLAAPPFFFRADWDFAMQRHLCVLPRNATTTE
jgi:hypothetical protein